MIQLHESIYSEKSNIIMASSNSAGAHGFSTSSLEKKLKDLNGTLQSIQGMAQWLIHHRKNAKTVVSLWYKELQKGGVRVHSN